MSNTSSCNVLQYIVELLDDRGKHIDSILCISSSNNMNDSSKSMLYGKC